MPSVAKPQRIRDPLHNLIEFNGDQLERTLWSAISTRPFQRLRRIRQLGFSEFVFPGATHSRFAHSIGVFHTARQLMTIIHRHVGEENHQSRVALAASLVHDVGHGMFSHAFEEIGKALSLPLARHEEISEMLVRSGDISEVFQREFGSGFSNDVADLLRRKEPSNLYDSIVSSQFDADRLDYMQRDRLMTGVQSSGIDATWLLANLEIGRVSTSADDETAGLIDTLVLGPKAFHAAENYVLSLFQLYPNIYFHKTTRGAEKLFSCLMIRILNLAREGNESRVGLPSNHPFLVFAKNPNKVEHVLALDDSLFWGTLPLLADAEDLIIKTCAGRFVERRLPKCIDVRRYFEEQNPVRSGMSSEDRQAREARIRINCKEVYEEVKELASARGSGTSQILVDEARRGPYKKFQDSKTPLNQILIRQGQNRFEDMASLSPVVSSAETFEICRVYHFPDDTDGRDAIWNILRTKMAGAANG